MRKHGYGERNEENNKAGAICTDEQLDDDKNLVWDKKEQEVDLERPKQKCEKSDRLCADQQEEHCSKYRGDSKSGGWN